MGRKKVKSGNEGAVITKAYDKAERKKIIVKYESGGRGFGEGDGREGR